MVPRRSISNCRIFPWNQVPWTYVAGQNVRLVTGTFKLKGKPDFNTSKFKARYFVIG